jgi:cob(I)alamin adenosyltransferase
MKHHAAASSSAAGDTAGARGQPPLEFGVVTTRSGDRGETGLFSGDRLRKDDVVFETMGELDTLNSHLGLAKARAEEQQEYTAVDFIDSVQSDIIALSALVATNPHGADGSRLYEALRQITDEDIRRIEEYEHELLEAVDIEPVFVNPGETELAARLDMARTQTRTAERRLVTLIRERGRSDLYAVQRYVNRLSDLLFVMARYHAL